MITKTHAIFGKVRFDKDEFDNYKPLAGDIAKALKLNDIKYCNNHLLTNQEILQLISKSDLKNVKLFKNWIFSQKLNKKQNFTYQSAKDVLMTLTDDDFVTLPIHPISNNDLWHYDGRNMVTTPEYRAWKDAFPSELLKEFKHIDFNRPIMAVYKYTHLHYFDTENFNKATSDAICSYFATNDHCIRIIYCEAERLVEDVNEGQIKVYLCNVEAGM